VPYCLGTQLATRRSADAAELSRGRYHHPDLYAAVGRAQASGVLVLFGSQSITPASVVTPSANAADLLKPTTVTSSFDGCGRSYIIRLRVDGVDSLPITLGGSRRA